MKRKRICLIFAFCLVISLLSPTVFAASTDDLGVSTTLPLINSGGISLDSTEMPSKSDLYTNDKTQYVSGEASRSNLYSNKCFKGVTSIDYAIHNARSEELKVVLRKYWGVFQTSVETIEISGKVTQYGRFDDLDSDTYYFLDFYPPSKFDGTVEGNE